MRRMELDLETRRVRGEQLHLIGRMAAPHWYCRTRDRFEMPCPKSTRHERQRVRWMARSERHAYRSGRRPLNRRWALTRGVLPCRSERDIHLSLAATLRCRNSSRMSDDAPERPKVYHGFGGRLYHDVPAWVREDAIFHIRVRCQPACPLLTQPALAKVLLDSVRFYHAKERWWVHLFLLMPDHWHALLSFGPPHPMSKTLGDWKGFHARRSGLLWQEGYFDHRLRNHLADLDAKHEYIRQNPVVKGLCARPEDWPWQWTAADMPLDTRPE
jgi:REP element-mobilizing transposase RayT